MLKISPKKFATSKILHKPNPKRLVAHRQFIIPKGVNSIFKNIGTVIAVTISQMHSRFIITYEWSIMNEKLDQASHSLNDTNTTHSLPKTMNSSRPL